MNSTAMNVVVVGFGFNVIGGLEIVSKAIAAAAASRHSVRCLALHESGRVQEAGYEIVGLSPASRLMRGLSTRFPAIFPPADLSRYLTGADVVVVAHPHTLSAVLPALETTASAAPVVGWLHGREVWGRLGRAYVPFLDRCDKLVSVSHYTANVVATMLPGLPRVEVIHNPVDTDLFRPADPGRGEVVRRHTILTVGRHDADSFHKGYDMLIEAMALLRDRRPDLPLQLTVIGTGKLLDHHYRQIERLAVQDRVLLAGRVSRSELIRLYRQADVFAFPSRLGEVDGEEYGEGFGVVNAEAAASGRPVITSTHGGCSETVIDGVTGFAVDPTSALPVAAAIESLFDMTANDRDVMGRRGRQMAVERFSLPTFQNRVNQMLASVCPSRPNHSSL